MSDASRAPNPIVLLDESVGLLRRAPAGAWLAWVAGSLPFGLAAIAFVTEVTSSADAAETLPGHALALAVLYLWMVCWQAAFSRGLWPVLTGEAPAARIRFWPILRNQALLWTSALVLIPISAVSVAGFPWTVAFFYNAAAYPASAAEPTLRELIRYASARASTWRVSAGLALGVAMLVWVVALVNSAVLLLGAPLLLRTLTGQESVFTRDIQGMFNSTLVAGALTMACLGIDPLLRAMFVVRCFRADAIRTGIDLKATVARYSGVAALLIILLSLSAAAMAATPVPDRPSINAPALDRTIREVTKRPEYLWHEPRLPGVSPGSNAFLAFTEQSVEFISKQGARLLAWIRDAVNALVRWLMGNKPEALPEADRGGPDARIAAPVLYLLIVAAAGAGIALLFRVRFRRRGKPVAAQPGPAAASIDLTSEDVSPDQAPQDEWLAMAAEFVNAGDLRLATRALYLATLAGLGRSGLLTLHRSRSNLDYRRELARRARANPAIQQTFGNIISAFERTWYGLHPMSREAFDNFHGNVLAMRTDAPTV